MVTVPSWQCAAGQAKISIVNRALTALAASPLLLGALASCGASGSKAINVAYAPPGPESECQAATVRLLQAVPGVADPAMDAAAVKQRVGNGAPACLGFDAATLDRIYTQAIPEFLASPSGAKGSPGDPTPAPPASPADKTTATPAAKAEDRDRTEECRAAIRKIVKAGVAAEKAGKDRAAAEEKVTADLEKDKPCKGVNEDLRDSMFISAEQEFGGR
jgi:hypothetical protein